LELLVFFRAFAIEIGLSTTPTTMSMSKRLLKQQKENSFEHNTPNTIGNRWYDVNDLVSIPSNPTKIQLKV